MKRLNLASILLLALFLVCFYAVVAHTLIRYGNRGDDVAMQLGLRRVLYQIALEEEDLGEIASDFASWEEVRGAPQSRVASGLMNRLFTTDMRGLRLDYLFIVSLDGEFLLHKTFFTGADAGAPDGKNLPSALLVQAIGETLPKVSLDGKKATTGIFVVGDTPVLYAARQIRQPARSQASNTPHFVFALRMLNNPLIEKISTDVRFPFYVMNFYLSDKASIGANMVIAPDSKSKTLLAGRALVRDSEGRPILWIASTVLREGYIASKRGCYSLFLMLVAGFAVYVSIAEIAFRRFLYKHLTRAPGWTEIKGEDAGEDPEKETKSPS